MKRFFGVILVLSLLTFIGCSDDSDSNNNAVIDGNNYVFEDLVGIWGWKTTNDSLGDELYLVINFDRTGAHIFTSDQFSGGVLYRPWSLLFVDGGNFCYTEDGSAFCQPFSFLSDGRFVFQTRAFNRLSELPEHILNALE